MNDSMSDVNHGNGGSDEDETKWATNPENSWTPSGLMA